jgi:hypothetical protein
MDKPYTQKKLSSGKLIREFSSDTNSDELKWHRDENNRLIRVLNENDWLIQFEDDLPIELIEGEYLHIPEKMFHRVIKGKSNLVIEIEEFDLSEVSAINEGKKKDGKKDACYHKVKSRYKVWPSAYASGALVKCRKVGAKNWGNSTKESDDIQEEWSEEERKKRAKNCDNPKGFTMKQFCKNQATKSKKGEKKNESLDGVELYEAKKRKLTSKPSSETSLRDWFKRKGGKGSAGGWVDCNTCRKDSKTGRMKCKPCGRQEGEKRAKFPACRPTPGACKKYKESKGKSWGKKSKTNENLDSSKKIYTFVKKDIESLINENLNK